MLVDMMHVSDDDRCASSAHDSSSECFVDEQAPRQLAPCFDVSSTDDDAQMVSRSDTVTIRELSCLELDLFPGQTLATPTKRLSQKTQLELTPPPLAQPHRDRLPPAFTSAQLAAIAEASLASTDEPPLPSMYLEMTLKAKKAKGKKGKGKKGKGKKKVCKRPAAAAAPIVARVPCDFFSDEQKTAVHGVVADFLKKRGEGTADAVLRHRLYSKLYHSGKAEAGKVFGIARAKYGTGLWDSPAE